MVNHTDDKGMNRSGKLNMIRLLVIMFAICFFILISFSLQSGTFHRGLRSGRVLRRPALSAKIENARTKIRRFGNRIC